MRWSRACPPVTLSASESNAERVRKCDAVGEWRFKQVRHSLHVAAGYSAVLEARGRAPVFGQDSGNRRVRAGVADGEVKARPAREPSPSCISVCASGDPGDRVIAHQLCGTRGA